MNALRTSSCGNPVVVDELNELLARLSIPLPFALETPSDLTPGLLLGILESIMQSRLPISASVRSSRDFTNKVQAMKIFLGVLESDVLGGEDVGLSELDPRSVANGDEEEVEFIGQLLCWLGRRKGVIAGPSRAEDDPPPCLPPHTRRRASSPSTHSTVTSGVHSNLSIAHTTGLANSDTTVSSITSDQLTSLTPTLPELPSLPRIHTPRVPSRSASSAGSGRQQPRCIHEIEEPSFLFPGKADVSGASSVCRCNEEEEDDLPPAAPCIHAPIRYDGQINNADEHSELHTYYERRSPPRAATTTTASASSRRAKSYSGLSVSLSQLHPSRQPPSTTSSSQTPSPHARSASGARRIITPHNAPTAEYTLALLNERARLLDALAQLKGARSAAT